MYWDMSLSSYTHCQNVKFYLDISKMRQKANGQKTPTLKELCAILAEKVSTDTHFKNLAEIVDHPGKFGIFNSTHYDLEHSTLRYYLIQIVVNQDTENPNDNILFNLESLLLSLQAKPMKQQTSELSFKTVYD